jgi:hypothetical protein
LFDVNAVFAARYLLDEQGRDSDTGSASFEDRVTWEEELFISTRSYVYHPGFLNIDFGFGPKLVQQQFDSNAGSNRGNETFLNLNARLNVLQLKSYTFSLYYLKDNPSVTTGLAGRYILEREEYGLNAMLYQRAKTSVQLDTTRTESAGEGFGTVLDENLDSAQLKASTVYGEKNTIDFRQSLERRESASGSIGLPIQASITGQDVTELKAVNFFGSAGRNRVSQAYRKRKNDRTSISTTSENTDYTFVMNLYHTDRLWSVYDYSFAGFDRGDTDASTQNLRATVSDKPNQYFNYSVNTFYQSEEQLRFNRDTLGAGTRGSLRVPIKSGAIGVGFNVTQARTDQQSDTDFVQVFDEALVLVGTNPVALSREFVVGGSVVVRNVSNTQTYIENIDYRLVVVGSVTSIQRLLGSNIQDGQTVLVDYEYQTSGTAKFDSLSASLNANADFLKYFSADVNLQFRETKLRSGELTTPINNLESLRLGIGADFPVGARWQFGVSASYTKNEEEINPSVSNTLTIQAATYLWQSTSLNLSASSLKVDQQQSIEDIDRVQYGIGLNSRLWSRLRVGYQASYLEDDGGSLPRREVRHRIDMNWNYRAVRFLLRATRSDETLGATERDNTQVTAEVVRLFR